MNSLKMSNLTVRVTDAERDLVQRAARAARMNVSDYMRSVLVPWAASDLGERVPQMAKEKLRRRPEGPITLAAKARGITRDAYRQMAAELLARMDLEPAARPIPMHRMPTEESLGTQRPSEMRLRTGR